MKIFIGCSSSNEINKKYILNSKDYVNELLIDNDLVFGASNSGLMGMSYKTALKNKNQVTGICPKAYKNDLNNLNCTYEILTNSISDRTTELINKSDAIVFLPGGIGTIYELFTVIECKRSGEFDKPIVIYNSCGYFDKLFEFLDYLYNEKFTDEKVKECYYISNSAKDTLKYIRKYNEVKKL